MAIPFEIVMDQSNVIRGDFYPASSIARGILIVSHGFKGFKNWGMFPYAAAKLAQDVDVITFDFTHNGVGEDGQSFSELDKFAKNTYSCELDDLSTLISVLTDEWDFKNKLLKSDRLKPVVFILITAGGLIFPTRSISIGAPLTRSISFRSFCSVTAAERA